MNEARKERIRELIQSLDAVQERVRAFCVEEGPHSEADHLRPRKPR